MEVIRNRNVSLYGTVLSPVSGGEGGERAREENERRETEGKKNEGREGERESGERGREGGKSERECVCV